MTCHALPHRLALRSGRLGAVAGRPTGKTQAGPLRPLALFVPTLVGGGAERVLVDVAREIAARGRAVDVVVLNTHDLTADALGPDVRIVDLQRRRMAFAGAALIRYLRRARPTAVLSTLEHANLLAVAAVRIVGGTRVVIREANTLSADLAGEGVKGRILRLAMRYGYRAAHGVIAVSQGVADGLVSGLGLPPDRIQVIFNPVLTPRVHEGARAQPDHPWFAPGAVPVVLAVGRLAPQKGFDVLLRAFARTRAQRACRLLILGEGPLRDELAELARELKVEKDVDLHGFHDNPFAFMARCGAFVLSSRWEGLPNVLIQAVAVGASPVATDCPSGPREILDGGRWGRLVPVGDHQAMADAILATLERPAERPPQEWARRYALDAVTSAYLAQLDRSPHDRQGNARAHGH